MTAPVYELEEAGLRVEDQVILDSLKWTIPASAVSVVFGAGGAGKTSLLRALAGVRGPPVVPFGSWHHRQKPLFGPERSAPLVQGVAWSAQPPRDWRRERGRWGPGLRRALAQQDASVLLLDEPNAWVHYDDYPELIAEIRKRAAGTAVVVSTHHVGFGEACADHACLLGGNRILVAGDAASFFGSRSPYIRHLLRSGSVWPGAVPEAPPSFRWVLDERLGGMAQPGLTGPVRDDLKYLAAYEVSTLVTLTEKPLDVEPVLLAEHGISRVIHFPIRDMGVPSMGEAAALTWRLTRALEAGEVVVLHCRGGLGRTGLMLALLLLARGHSAREAVEQLRAIQSLYIQTEGQLSFVRAMERYIDYR